MLKVGIIFGYLNFFSYLCKKDINFMATFVFLLMGLCIVLAVCLMEYIDDKDREKNNRLAEIKNIQRRITEDFEDIIDLAPRYGNEYYDSLMDFANKMEKILTIKEDLKPYDAYFHKKLYEDKKTHMGSKFIGRIVIDKNIVPRFMVTPQSTIPSQCDIELEVALTSDGVRQLAENCRRTKMEADMEEYRKDKVKKILNG
jgi:hypothetical protein